MDDWETYAEEPIAIAAAGDSDDDSDVKDSWDVSSDEEKIVEKPKKKTLQQKIQEKQEAEEKKKQELAEKREEKERNEDPNIRKARLEQLVQEADMKNLNDLFDGSANLNEKEISSTFPIEKEKILSSKPVSKEQHEEYAKALVERILNFKSKGSVYVPFLEKLFHGLSSTLDYADIRKLSSSLSTLANEKQRQEKIKSGGAKKSSKKFLKVESNNNNNIETYNDYGDTYDDFM